MRRRILVAATRYCDAAESRGIVISLDTVDFVESLFDMLAKNDYNLPEQLSLAHQMYNAGGIPISAPPAGVPGKVINIDENLVTGAAPNADITDADTLKLAQENASGSAAAEGKHTEG